MSQIDAVPVSTDFNPDDIARLQGIAERLGIAWSCQFGGLNRWECTLWLPWPARSSMGLRVDRFDAPINGPALIDGLCWGALCAGGFSGSLRDSTRFAAWCGSHGLDKRSVAARARFLEARKTARKLARFLGDTEYGELWLAGIAALPRMLERKARQARAARISQLADLSVSTN